MEKPLGKIKVCLIHDPKKIISYVPKGYSKEETLDKIRPKINKMKKNHLFVDSDGDIIDFDLEKESTIEDILVEEEGKSPKIFIADPEYSNQENQEKKSNQLINPKENVNLSINDNKEQSEEIKKLKEKNKIKNNLKIISDEIFYNSCILENNEQNKFNNLFFDFYFKLFNIGINFAQLSLQEITNDIIYLSKKNFYIGKNFGIIDNIQIYDKKDTLLLQEFIFIIHSIEVFGKNEKKNYVKIFMEFKKIFNNMKQNVFDDKQLNNIIEVLKDIIPKYNTNYIYIEIFLKKILKSKL